MNSSSPSQSDLSNSPSELLQNHTLHRTISQIISPPQLRLFSSPDSILYQKYYDHQTTTVVSSDLQLSPVKMEYSIHLCSKRFGDDVKIVFPDARSFTHLYAIPTFQPISTDMTAFTFEAGEFKDHMLDNTISILLTLHSKIYSRAIELGLQCNDIFFDGTDPSTGLPYLTTNSSSIYSEIDGSTTLLRYQREQSGSCSLLKHPIYGLSCYPSTFFIAGFPIDEFIAIINEISIPHQ